MRAALYDFGSEHRGVDRTLIEDITLNDSQLWMVDPKL
jgi:hypothetical protein